jgi:hypothetical protein
LCLASLQALLAAEVLRETTARAAHASLLQNAVDALRTQLQGTPQAALPL